MKFKTILEGRQAVIFNYLGEGRLIQGPARVFLFRERLQRLQHYTATAYEYLKIKDNEGYVTHEIGPCERFLNPLEVTSIRVLPATQIDANHVVVVYKKLKDQSVERRIIEGPTVFMPHADEWLHQFKWHGPDRHKVGRMLPEMNMFTQVHIVPSNFYYNVSDVRTMDDTMLSVRLLIFYEIKDILKMLDNTKDPISDMINAVCADVIAFAGRRTLIGFLESASGLNKLTLFPQLLTRSDKIGFTVSKVVYRGYHAGDKLQAMQDATIQSRTEMRLMTELQEQEQRLKDFRLQMEQDRSKLIQEMEQSKLEHSQRVETLKQSHQLQMKRIQHDAAIANEKMETQTKLFIEMESQMHSLEHYTGLKNLGVNLTQYLVQGQEPAPNEEYRIVKQ